MDIELVVKVILSRHFGVHPDCVMPHRRFEDLGLDEMDQIDFQMKVEKELKITFTPYESDNMDTIEDCLHAIANKKEEGL